jgi:hypothetical protein
MASFLPYYDYHIHNMGVSNYTVMFHTLQAVSIIVKPKYDKIQELQPVCMCCSWPDNAMCQ